MKGFEILVLVWTAITPILASEICLQGCCGLKFELSSPHLLLVAGSATPLGTSAEKAPTVQITLAAPAINCCPCEDTIQPPPGVTLKQNETELPSESPIIEAEKPAPKAAIHPISNAVLKTIPLSESCCRGCCGKRPRPPILCSIGVTCCPNCDQLLSLEDLAVPLSVIAEHAAALQGASQQQSLQDKLEL